MTTCSTCHHWQGDEGAYAADCALRILTRPAFNQVCPAHEGRSVSSDEEARAALMAALEVCCQDVIVRALGALQGDGFTLTDHIPLDAAYLAWERPLTAEKRTLLNAWLRAALALRWPFIPGEWDVWLI